MFGGKTLDVHVNIETESKTWAGPICVLDPIFASIIPMDPCQIAIVSRHKREIEGHLNICESLRGNLGAVHVTRSDETVRVKVVHLRIQALENERQEVRGGVDPELYVGREGEVGRRAAKLWSDGLVKPARGGCEGPRPVDGKVRYAWDDNAKGDSDDGTEREDGKHDRASSEPLAAE